MLRDGFLRFCDDPELACCRAEAELGQLRAENTQLRIKLAVQEQMHEFAKAKEEGRLVMLSCKEGDKVTAEVIRPYNGHKLTIHGEIVDIETVVRVKHSGCRYIDFMVDDFGKTVFLNR